MSKITRRSRGNFGNKTFTLLNISKFSKNLEIKFVIHYSKFVFNRVKLRFEEHQKGRVVSTKNRRPLKLIYCEACLDRKDAMRREKYFKTHLGKMFLKSRLKSYLTGRSIL